MKGESLLVGRDRKFREDYDKLDRAQRGEGRKGLESMPCEDHLKELAWSEEDFGETRCSSI